MNYYDPTTNQLTRYRYDSRRALAAHRSSVLRRSFAGIRYHLSRILNRSTGGSAAVSVMGAVAIIPLAVQAYA